MFNINTETSDMSKAEKDNLSYVVDCIVCSQNFKDAREFCQHMVLDHKIVIAESKTIAHFKG